jgi:hypothetical protein
VSLVAIVAMAHGAALAAAPATPSVESFAARPPQLQKNHATEKIAAREMDLTAGHLKLKAGAHLYRIVGAMADPRVLALLDSAQAEPSLYGNDDWGWFFQAIDTPEKATELVELPLAGALIVKTPGQFQAILAAARKQRGFQEAQHVVNANPPSFGLSVAAQNGGAYHVQMLIGTFGDSGDLGYVGHFDCLVSREGRIVCKNTTCLSAIGAGNDAERSAMRAALTPAGSEKIAPLYKVTATNVQIPCDARFGANQYLNDYAQWPKE